MSPYDLLQLPKSQRALMKRLLKERVISLSDAAEQLGQDEAKAVETLGELVEKTFLIEFEKKGETYFKILLARKAGRELPFDIWQDLLEKTGT